MTTVAGKDELVTLKVGDTAPDIRTTDVLGTPFDLKKAKTRFVFLAFMRYSGCPWCNLAIHRLALEYPTFQESDCEVIAFMQSDAANIKSNIYDRHAVRPEFPIIPDPDRRFYDQYGIRDSKAAFARSITKIPSWVNSVRKHGFKQTSIDGELFLVPAYFLIDTRNGKIVSVNYGKSFYDHDTFVRLYEDIFFHAY